MCEYTEGTRVYRACAMRPRHIVTVRFYETCWHQSAYGIQRICAICTYSGHNGGISPVLDPCPTCQDESETTIERYAVIPYDQSRAKTIA
ncbi:hypothetical protein PENANT_c012G04450 [Penicillium antarcticum]|uniref:Uncharacterized protein n=1 Tax=Penicillium antarcticum TaxID=416450 RepID=A0A1V6Q649_9EURO|nr:uncharacterized protein N7508_008186 [Penicillium antarcticum]KAJ5297937.1 hypothetical protein N7508_008186 [Penicillium antarcticum]OQD84710.1 hypothetical protein PENANT_c012G04450 [Penicillium antarcticum]